MSYTWLATDGVRQERSGSPYIVMEFLEGEDLEVRLERVGRLDVATTVHIAKQLGSALAAAHAKNIVHRDLKPQNVYRQACTRSVCTAAARKWQRRPLPRGRVR